MKKEFKCWFSYSSFGNYVSDSTHEQIYDDIILYVPDDIDFFKNDYGYVFEVPGGFRYDFNQLFVVRNGVIFALWFDGDKSHLRKCNYRRV